MNLKIEQGILVMSYVAPWSGKEKAHRKPDAWTPDRTPEMHIAFDALKVENPTTPDYMLWDQVEADEAERMAGSPWPGWVPQVYSRGGIDKKIGDAYKALYVRMNPDNPDLLARGVSVDGHKAIVPQDGDYTFRGGIMKHAPTLPLSLTGPWSAEQLKMARDAKTREGGWTE